MGKKINHQLEQSNGKKATCCAPDNNYVVGV